MYSNTSQCDSPMQSFRSDSVEARITFLGGLLTQWTGGVDFLRLCISGLSSTASACAWDLLIPEPTLNANDEVHG